MLNSVPHEIKTAHFLDSADRLPAEMNKFSGFIKFCVKQNRLHKDELQQARNQASCRSSEQRADNDAGKHVSGTEIRLHDERHVPHREVHLPVRARQQK